jgi:hypothetical protein
MSSHPDDEVERQSDRPEAGGVRDLGTVVAELKRLVAHPLAPRHVGTFRALSALPAVRTVLPPDAGSTRSARAIVAVIAEAIRNLDGQTLRLRGLSPITLDAADIQHVMSQLLGITELGQTDESSAPVRRALAAKALGLDLAALGGDKGFRQIHEPVLLAIIAAQLVSTEEQIPGWLVENVAYRYTYNKERVLASTNYRYEVISQRDGEDFFINHTASENLGGFELVDWTNCEVLERNQLENRTIELHFRLHEGAAGSRTHFSYQLKPTDPHMAPDKPRLITIGQLGVASVDYLVDFETPPEKVWTLGAIPPPLAGSPQLEVPTAADDPRLLNPPYDHVAKSFRALRIRHFYGIAWKW